MVEREATARWVRRIGSVAALTILAFLLGELSAREGRSETPAADPALSAQPDKRYGPNPNYRLTPQINRIIRLAQRDQKEDDKGRATGGGGPQLKTAPVQKKTAPVLKKTAPVKKSTTPTTRKKETAPVKKKETAPVKKKVAPVKKDTAPAAKKKIAPVKKDAAPAIKKEIAPVTKEVAPAESTVPGAPPSDEQLQENIEFCAQNPDAPSCSKETPPATEPAPATEKICSANPKYPGCDKLGAPSLGPAPEDAGKVGSICEQNPQLPQCQQGEEATQPDETVDGPPEAPGADAGGPPGFIPPGAPAPVPPGPPPSPPPADDDEETTGPTGPTIQTVAQCDEGQRLSITGECFEPCPEGTSWYAGPGVNHNTCVAECPAYENGYADDGTGQCRQCYGGTIADGQCQCNAPYVSNPNPNAYSLCEPCNQLIYEGQCIAQCPQGLLNSQGVCVAECPADRVQGEGDYAGTCVLAECPEGLLLQGQSCVEQCSQGYVQSGEQCRHYCPEDLVEHEGQCVAECPSDRITYNGQCLTECPENLRRFVNQCLPERDCPGDQVSLQTGESFEGECVDSCPAGSVELYGGCVGTFYCAEWGGRVHEGECVETCPEGSLAVGVQCVSQCPAETIAVGNECTTCPEGQRVLNGECRPICEYGQVDVAGTCRPIEEVGYDEFIHACAEQEGAAVGDYPGFDYSGQSPQRLCELLVEVGCGSGGLLQTDMALCADRPPLCGEGEVLATDGSCTASCGEGQYVLNDFQCTSDCSAPQSVLGNECRSGGCPQGYETEGSDDAGYQCVADCPPGQSRGDDGQCSNPCPEGQVVIPYLGCRATCADGLARQGSLCTAVCPSGKTPVNGICVDSEAISYDAAVAACENSDPHFVLFEGRHETSACAEYIAELCDNPGQTGSNEARYCAEMPAAGETVVAEGPTDGEAPPDGAAPAPPDDGAPPPDQTAPPPEGSEAPPAPADETQPPAEETPPPPDDAAPPPPPADGGAPLPPPEGAPPPPGGAPPPIPPDGAPPPGTPPGPPSPPPQGTPLPRPPLHDGKSPALPPSGEAKPEGALAKPVAVVIATDNYKDSGIPGAPQAIDNAAHMVRFLKDDLGLDGTRIVTGRNATLSDFEDIFGKPGDTKSELRDVLSKMRTPEVIVYYAGHAKALNGGKDVLLLPADAEPDKPETGVSLSALYNQLAAMGIPKLRVYLDPSFVPGDTVANVQTAPRIGPFGVLTPRDWVALSAASDSAAFDSDVKRPRSLFTESLVAGLRGIADTTGEGDGDGTVSAQELYDFMRGQAEAATKRGDKVPMPSFYGPPGEALRAY